MAVQRNVSPFHFDLLPLSFVRRDNYHVAASTTLLTLSVHRGWKTKLLATCCPFRAVNSVASWSIFSQKTRYVWRAPPMATRTVWRYLILFIFFSYCLSNTNDLPIFFKGLLFEDNGVFPFSHGNCYRCWRWAGCNANIGHRFRLLLMSSYW